MVMELPFCGEARERFKKQEPMHALQDEAQLEVTKGNGERIHC
jgi:hypothetical protein